MLLRLRRWPPFAGFFAACPLADFGLRRMDRRAAVFRFIATARDRLRLRLLGVAAFDVERETRFFTGPGVSSSSLQSCESTKFGEFPNFSAIPSTLGLPSLESLEGQKANLSRFSFRAHRRSQVREALGSKS